METVEYGERRERVLLRPWLENLINSGCIPGLEWIDEARTMFKVPWKHRSKKNWSLRHSSVFLEWAKNTGRWKEGDPEPNYAQLKTRLRCAFNKAPDIDEMKELHCTKSEEPYKVYRFMERKDGKTRPLVRMFVTKTSTGPQIIRRRRRPKLAISKSIHGMSSVGGHGGMLPPISSLKMEPLGENACCYQAYDYPWKTEIPTSEYCSKEQNGYMDMPIHRTIPLAVEIERYGEGDFKTISPATRRILPPPEADYVIQSPPDWNLPFSVDRHYLSSSSMLTSSNIPAAQDSRLLILQAASEVVEAIDHHPRDVEERYRLHSATMNGSNHADVSSCMSQSDKSPVSETSGPKHSSVATSATDALQNSAPVKQEDDEVAPPMVRFKKRYLQSQKLEEQQKSSAGEQCVDGDSLRTSSPLSPSELFMLPPCEKHRPVLSDTEVTTPNQNSREQHGKSWPVYESQLAAKRVWSRTSSDVVNYKDPELPGGMDHAADYNDRRGMVQDQDLYYEPANKQRHIAADVKPELLHKYAACRSPKTFMSQNQANRSGGTQNLPYREPLANSPENVVNLSYKSLSPSGSDISEAMDLSKKPSVISDVSKYPVNKGLVDVLEQWPKQPLTKRECCEPIGDSKELVYMEQDYRRKHDLIFSKTAVLIDKERQLLALEQELSAREQALAWQENHRQLHDSTSLRPAPEKYQRSTENAREFPGKYIGRMERNQYVGMEQMSPAAAGHLRSMPRILPPHESNRTVIGEGGWPVEKLEEQFAKLTQNIARESQLGSRLHDYDAAKAEYSDCLQKRMEPMPRAVPNGHEDFAYRYQRSVPALSNFVRKRGRPKGSKNRNKLRPMFIPGMSHVPFRDQWKHNAYAGDEMIRNDHVPDVSSVKHEHLGHTDYMQMMEQKMGRAKLEPVDTGHSEMSEAVEGGFPSPSALKMFSGGQILFPENGQMLGGRPPFRAEDRTRNHQLMMAPKVRQMLESTAATTGASILPPLSPTPASNDDMPHLNRKGSIAYRGEVAESSTYDGSLREHRYLVSGETSTSNNLTDRATNYRAANFDNGYTGRNDHTTDISVKCERRPFDGHMPDDNNRFCFDSTAERRSRGDHNVDSRILPNVSELEAGRQWDVVKQSRIEEWRRGVASCYSMNCEDSEGDGRLVVVVDGE